MKEGYTRMEAQYVEKSQIKFLSEKTQIGKGKLSLDSKTHGLKAGKHNRARWSNMLYGFSPLKTLHLVLSVTFSNFEIYVFIIMSS